jgi:hypothetical protein
MSITAAHRLRVWRGAELRTDSRGDCEQADEYALMGSSPNLKEEELR